MDVIKKYQVLNDDFKKVEGPGQPCWASIQKELGNVINAKYIYTIVLQNRFGVADKLSLNNPKFKTIVPQTATLHVVEELGINLSDEDEYLDITDNDEFNKTLNFNITISPQEWQEIYEENPKFYKRSDGKSYNQIYEVLKPYKWTPIINEHFFEQTKLPCYITYKYAKIYREGAVFLDIMGSCFLCLSTLKCIAEHTPEANSRVWFSEK